KLVLSVACSPDGKQIASGGFGDTGRLWGAGTGAQTALFKGGRAIRSLAFSGGGETPGAGVWWAATTQVLDVGTLRELRTTKAKTLYRFSVALSPDGKRLAASGIERKAPNASMDPNQGRIHVWDLASGKGPAPIPISYEATSVVFSADSKYVLVAAYI